MEFEREKRYLVLKRKDVNDDVASEVLKHVVGVDLGRGLLGLPPREYLVVESDWPEFDPTWDAIQRRVEGRPTREAELQAEVERLNEDRDWQIRQNVRMFTVIEEAVKYLDTNHLTNIAHGSILHQQLRDALVTDPV